MSASPSSRPPPPAPPAKRHPVHTSKLKIFAKAKLPTRFGDFEVISFCTPEGVTINDVAIICGNVAGQSNVPTRVHSECLTGDVFGSYRCDCREQLELALKRVAQNSLGIVLYMRQEGRGIGIAAKVRAYELQEKGFDTVEANLHLGFDSDLRDYSLAAAMLKCLGVRSIKLYTNNPDKLRGLQKNGIEVSQRVEIVTTPRAQNAQYLSTKRDKFGHLL